MDQFSDALVAVQKSGRVFNRLMTETARTLGMTKPEMDILLFLHNNPQYDKAADISELRFLAKSYVSKAVDLLQKRGMLEVHTDENDRRIMRLRVTEAAAPALEKAKETQVQFLKLLFEGVTCEEIKVMQAIHGKMMKNLEKQ
ncbi:MAG: MarR family transcriptional regulator [Firmicutes bacterium]|nr:MarR family transcriptional regulator [Bacillota bacterium]